MIGRKLNKSKRKKRKKNLYISFALLMSLVISSYSTNDDFRLSNDSVSNRHHHKNESKFSTQEENPSDDGLKSENQNIGLLFVLFSILILFLSNILLVVIWKYLSNASVTKRCLLLYLYQDGLTTVLIAAWIWFAIIISCYVNNKGAMSNEAQATVLSIFLISVELQLILILNVVSIIKLYTMKEKVVDPPMPWNDDEDTILKKIRIITILSIILFVFSMYREGFYPKAYYYFVGDHTPLLNLSNGPKIFEAVLGILFIVPTITIFLRCFYAQTEEQSVANKQEGKVYVLVVTFIVIMVSGVIYGAFSDKMGHFLIIGQCLITIACVATPFATILLSDPLKSFAQKVASETSASLAERFHSYYGQINAFVVLHQRSPQIAPIV